MKNILILLHNALIAGIQHLYYNLYKGIVYKKTGAAEYRAVFILEIFLIAIVLDIVILLDTLITQRIRQYIPFFYFLLIAVPLWPYSYFYTEPKFKEIEKRYKTYTPAQRRRFAWVSYTVAVGSVLLAFFLVEFGKYLRQ